MTSVDVRCDGDAVRGWTCSVRIRDDDRDVSTHTVAVTAADLRDLAPGSDDPTTLVEASFAFLLEREPPGSILRTFDVRVIGRYFPEYEREIRERRRQG